MDATLMHDHPGSDDIRQTFDILSTPWSGVRWTALREGRMLGGTAASSLDLLRLLEPNERGWNIYVQLNPANSVGLRANAEGVTHAGVFLIDLDPDPNRDEGYSFRGPEYFVQECVASAEEILGLLLGPTILFSGRGAQAWVRFPHVPLDAEKRATFTAGVGELLRRIKSPPGYHVDPTCRDLARVARLPGTVNHKTGQRAALLSTGHEVPGVFDAVCALAPVPELSAPMYFRLPPERASWHAIWPALSESAKLFILRGAEYPGRHNAAWHTAKALFEAGCARDSALSVVMGGCDLSRPALAEGDARYAIHRAYDGPMTAKNSIDKRPDPT